jgi:zinc D-Ala-D-Ala dipeptidase
MVKFSFFKKLGFVILVLCLSCEQKNNQKENNIELTPTTGSKKSSNDSTVASKKIKKIKPIEITEPISVENGCHFENSMANQGLVNIAEVDPTILVDLKYSTTDNFVGKDVYDCLSACYLQKKAAEMLVNASNFLKNENDSLRLLVYDGGRPKAIQQILWDALPQFSPQKRKTFVADPAIGSIHNYGSAVDLTIADLNGNPLDMGTKYDFFGELAYPKFENRFLQEGKLSKTQIDNRQLLRKVMKKAGFTSIEYEWWHFNAVSRAKAKSLYNIIQ